MHYVTALAIAEWLGEVSRGNKTRARLIELVDWYYRTEDLHDADLLEDLRKEAHRFADEFFSRPG